LKKNVFTPEKPILRPLRQDKKSVVLVFLYLGFQSKEM
jgi:hypothetical protein